MLCYKKFISRDRDKGRKERREEGKREEGKKEGREKGKRERKKGRREVDRQAALHFEKVCSIYTKKNYLE